MNGVQCNMGKSNLKERKLAASCYDHLGGKLGEALFRLFLEKAWIERVDGEREYRITEQGYREFEQLGLDMARLCSSSRKKLCACVERNQGIFYDHTGALLGTLLNERLLSLGWIVTAVDKQYEITKAGYEGLKQLGIIDL